MVGVRGSLERDISSLRALGPGGGQISRVVHVSTRAAFGVFAEKYGFVQEGHTFLEKNMVSCKRGTNLYIYIYIYIYITFSLGPRCDGIQPESINIRVFYTIYVNPGMSR